jgi:hypothetical protein
MFILSLCEYIPPEIPSTLPFMTQLFWTFLTGNVGIVVSFHAAQEPGLDNKSYLRL